MTRGRVGDRQVSLNVRHFVPGYFEAIGFAPVAGRFPSQSDAATGLPAALLNSSAAAQMFPEGSPLGQTFETGDQTRPRSRPSP